MIREEELAMQHIIHSQLPIGVFDSGVGGLTVLNALQQHLPHESFLYLGDTARLPYGTKSSETVTRYAKQAVQLLINRGVKFIILACNTVSALALHSLQQEFPNIPILGVIEPGAIAACQASTHGRIAVIATEATVNACSYQQAIKERFPDATVIVQSCSLFVALAEEGWLEGAIPEAVAERYLRPLLLQHPDCLVLGCTHFPLLTQAIQKVVGNQVHIVDSAETTASFAAKMLQQKGLANPCPEDSARLRCFVTDDPHRFIRVAKQFLGLQLEASEVELVDLMGTSIY